MLLADCRLAGNNASKLLICMVVAEPGSGGGDGISVKGSRSTWHHRLRWAIHAAFACSLR
jgi:hypothetical protein